MEKRLGFGGFNCLGASRGLLTLTVISVLAIGVGVTRRNLTPPPLEALDPTFMKAVTTAVSQRDVKAILARRPFSGPVEIRLFTSCHEDQHCTVFTTMEFTDVRSEESTVSLRVAVSVLAESDSSHRLSGSSWQVRRTDSATNATSTYAGVFPNLEDLPPTEDSNAITGLLITIQSAIGRALVENGVSPKQDTDQIGRTGARQI